jgi:hypothetical protein
VDQTEDLFSQANGHQGHRLVAKLAAHTAGLCFLLWGQSRQKARGAANAKGSGFSEIRVMKISLVQDDVGTHAI